MPASNWAPATSLTKLTSCRVPHCGLLVSEATRGSAMISAASARPCDHSAKVCASRAYSNAAFAYGRAMVARSAIRDLGGQLLQQLCVGPGLDFASVQP